MGVQHKYIPSFPNLGTYHSLHISYSTRVEVNMEPGLYHLKLKVYSGRMWKEHYSYHISD